VPKPAVPLNWPRQRNCCAGGPLFALQGVHVKATDGIISNSPEKTMENVGILSSQGMIETDRTILKIMLEKQFADI
jgi:L-cysteine desulfidase